MVEKLLIEFKAKIENPENIRKLLLKLGAKHIKTTHQIDTYFDNINGRLKLREMEDKSTLVFYKRQNRTQIKKSHVKIVDVNDTINLKKVLSDTLGVKVTVDKLREIYMWNDIQVHIDNVKELGYFLEFEYTVKTPDEIPNMRRKIQNMMKQLGINHSNLIAYSYSDLLLKLNLNKMNNTNY